MHGHDGAKYRHTGIQRDTVNIILIRVDPHLPGTVPFTGVGCRPAPRAGSLDARIFCKTKVLQAIHVTFFIDKKVTMVRPAVSMLVLFFRKKVTMVRPAIPHPCATAHQPNLVTRKTRFDQSSTCLVFCFAFFAFPVFIFLFLIIDF